MRNRVLLLAAALLAASLLACACSPAATVPTAPTPPAPAPPATAPAAATSTASATPGVTPLPTPIPTDELDTRLIAPIASLEQHAAWSGKAIPPFDVRKVSIAADGLCLEVTPSGASEPTVTVAVDVATEPWRVTATGAYETNGTETIPVEYYTAFERDTFESCAAVLGGPHGEWPATPDAIVVGGYAPDEAMLPALREAMFNDPAAFGLERIGLPALSVSPLQDCSRGPCEAVIEPSPGLVCLSGGASYGGGTVAGVGIGLQRQRGAWVVVSVRLARQALADVQERAPDGC